MANKNVIPCEKGIDHTLSLIREGYMYISNRCHSLQTDIFETRLFGKKAICMRGKGAAELIYDEEKFKRNGAIPRHVVKSFLGKNGVQTLDGDTHRHRKAMLMSVMTQERLEQLINIVKRQWESETHRWERKKQVCFYEEMQKLLCKTACEWVGVPLKNKEVNKRTEDLASLFESAFSIGPAYWAGRRSRHRLNDWIAEYIVKIRQGKIHVEPGTILYHFALYRDVKGKLFHTKTAAVEVINLLRPIVAISIYINFLLLTIHHYPKLKGKLQTGDEQYLGQFIQEVRRFYPFFPFIAAIAKRDFIWNDYSFKKGTLTILDIYGTNHHPTYYENPAIFNPDRFTDKSGSGFGSIPQGAGDYWLGHRCAGEWATIEVMKVSLDFLINHMDYALPEQDLSFSMVQMPSIPHSKIIINNVTFK